ncbi:MAG: hypothetical protein GC193_05200 [Cryomorphaceae bacterium]|nr:hypothetical protein [Cryomorphaceae bacterium]
MKTTKVLSPSEREQIRAIWNDVYPAQLMHHTAETFDTYIDQLDASEHTLMNANNQANSDSDSAPVGWICTFNRNHERWFVLLVDSSCARQGCGTEVAFVSAREIPETLRLGGRAQRLQKTQWHSLFVATRLLFKTWI